MTLLIKLPGTLTNTTGLPRLITTLDGFPDSNLTDLFLFEDGSGTAPENSVIGRGAGVIEAPDAINNAYSWLSGGGLSLSGTQIMSAPLSDASTPWTLVCAGAMAGSVGGTDSERIGGIMGFKQFTGATVRGASMYMRGDTNWNSGTPVTHYQSRAADNGGIGPPYNLIRSSGIQEIGKRRLRVMTYNGSSTITATIFDKGGAVVASASYAATDAQMLTASGVTVANLNPCLGLSSATFAGGQQQIEAFARYSKVLDMAEINVILATCRGLGDSRGRAWL